MIDTEEDREYQGGNRHRDSVEETGSRPDSFVPDKLQQPQRLLPDKKTQVDVASHLARPPEQDSSRVPGTG